MPKTADQSQAQTVTLVDLGAIFVSLELSKSTWLVTALSPCSEKMSRYTVRLSIPITTTRGSFPKDGLSPISLGQIRRPHHFTVRRLRDGPTQTNKEFTPILKTISSLIVSASFQAAS